MDFHDSYVGILRSVCELMLTHVDDGPLCVILALCALNTFNSTAENHRTCWHTDFLMEFQYIYLKTILLNMMYLKLEFSKDTSNIYIYISKERVLNVRDQ